MILVASFNRYYNICIHQCSKHVINAVGANVNDHKSTFYETINYFLVVNTRHYGSL
jgi:hypothetical protein